MPYRLSVLSMGVAAGSILIAILALVISLASGIAQVVQWQRSGPRVKVAATMSIPYGAIADVGPPATVNATNSGRHPTTVNMWGFEIAGANGESVIDPHGGVFSPPLPHPTRRSQQRRFPDANHADVAVVDRSRVRTADADRAVRRSADGTGARQTMQSAPELVARSARRRPLIDAPPCQAPWV